MKKLLLFLLLMGQLTAAQFDIRIPQIVSGTDFTNVVVNPPALSLLGFDVSQAPTTYTPGAGVLTFIQTPTLANLNIALGVTLTASTTVGGNLVGLTNPGAITFLRINADNTVDTLSAANFLTAIGAGPAYTGTAGQVTVTGSVLSLPTAVTGVNSITSATGQALTLATLDGNSDMNMLPEGTGTVWVGSNAATKKLGFYCGGLLMRLSADGGGALVVTDYQGTEVASFYTGNTGRGGLYSYQLLPGPTASGFPDNTGTIGKAAQRWATAFFGPTGLKIGDGTNGPTITASGTSPNEILKLTGGVTSGSVVVRAGTGSATASLGGTIFDHFADVASVSTNGTEDDLYSDTTAANTLGADGDAIVETETVDVVAGVTKTARIRKYFAGTEIFDTGTITGLAGETNYSLRTEIIRESSTVVRVSVTASTTSASTITYVTYTRITGLTLSGTNLIKTTAVAGGAGVAVGDVINKQAKIEWKSAD